MEELLKTFDLVPIDLAMILTGAVLFVVLWQLLGPLVFKPFLALIEAREAATLGAGDQARRDLAESERVTNHYRAMIDDARAEATRAKLVVVDRAKTEADQIVATAEKEARERIELARAETEKHAEALSRNLDADVDTLAQDLVARLLEPTEVVEHTVQASETSTD